MPKKYDIAAKTGTYTNSLGEAKNRYKNIGEIHANQDGGYFARIDAYTMLGLCHAAIAKGEDSFTAGLFAPRDSSATPAHNPPSRPQQSPQAANFDDDIPF